MKATLHFPTEQFGFAEVEIEVDSPIEALQKYTETTRANNTGAGLPDKDYNSFVDRMLLGESNELEQYTQMSDEQKTTIQVIKRALKRLKTKE